MGPSVQNLGPVASAAAENRVCGEQGDGMSRALWEIVLSQSLPW